VLVHFQAMSCGWSNWESLGGLITAPPTVGQSPGYRLDLFVQSNGGIYHNWQLW
jgi:hypothetical protein